MTDCSKLLSVKNNEDKDVFMNVNGTPIYFSEDWNVGIGGGECDRYTRTSGTCCVQCA